MILIFGGAYQGKLEYARKNYGDGTVCDCSGGETPDFTKDIICGLDGFALECARQGREAADFFGENRGKWQDKILISTDVSQGVVPVDPVLRAFREMNGRMMLYLAGEAEQVVRVFCGIGRREK